MQKKHKKVLLFFTLFLSVALVATIWDLNQQKETKSHAAAATKLSFSQPSLQVNPNDPISLDVTMDPGTNAISSMTLVITYDNTKVKPTTTGIVPNTQAFSTTLDGPNYAVCNGNNCAMNISLGVGNDPTKAIKVSTKIATVNFQAIGSGTTQLSFDQGTQVFSVAATDQSNENVLASSTPTSVTISGNITITPGPTSSSQSPTPTTSAGGIPSPTLPNNNPTSNPTAIPSPTVTPSPTPISSTTINLQLALPGIGINGGNLHPLHPSRGITFYLYNVDNGSLLTRANTVIFDGSYFVRPVIDLGQIPDGNYQIFIRSPQFLTSRLLQGTTGNAQTSTIQVKTGQPIQTQPNDLIAGDIAPEKGTTIGDNVLDILDYNALLSCYGNRANKPSCLDKLAADLDDNGVIDAIDYNILLRGFSLTHNGDTIPGQDVLSARTKKQISITTPTIGITSIITPLPVVNAQVTTNKFFGVNIAGAEFGAPSGNYTYASTATGYSGFSYFKTKGQNIIRIPFTWERMQPNLMGDLATNDVTGLTNMLKDAQTNGQQVILDVHNYARYQGNVMTTADTPKFADFWTKMANTFKSNSSIWGYELMNEPHDLNGGCGTWEVLAQAGVNAIRQTDTSHYILIPGYSWQSAHDWQTQSDCLLSVTDPANKLIFSAHQYFDSDYSGTKYSSSPCSDTTRGVTLVQPFLNWLASHGKQGMFTEYGVTGDSCWLTTLDNFLGALNNDPNIVGGTYWAAGPWWGNYEMSVDPSGGEKPQMSILQKY